MAQARCSAKSLAACSFLFLCPASVFAGGGGENMLLVVNPNDESALRIANAYARLRNVPDNNILFIAPATVQGYNTLAVATSQFASTYQAPILNAIQQRGLSGQIDYIGTIGSPQLLSGSYKDPITNTYISMSLSMGYALSQLTQLQNGMTYNQSTFRSSEIYQNRQDIGTYNFTYQQGTNAAIHHSQQLTPTGATGSATSAQWYMGGMVGYAGTRGMTPTQAIAHLERTVAADGTKPQGTIYFENNTNIRSTTRAPYWPAVQQYMTAHGIPWVQHENAYGAPKNCPDVRGAVVGAAIFPLPNGSTYLPGSYADTLTSLAGVYSSSAHTKASSFLNVGAGGSSGAITEPYAYAQRFTNAGVFVYSGEGSTLGEAFYKSVLWPDLVMFQGDMLSQAYADVPSVHFTSAPADLAAVSGSLSLSASASLNNPAIATGIDRMELFVDGSRTSTSVAGGSGSFDVDTTALSDGVHELRVVAYNNSQAASQSAVIRKVLVNNKGQAVTVVGDSTYSAAANQTLSLAVQSAQGTGAAVTSIQLQCLGRVVGSGDIASGNIPLNSAALAYGDNLITPVAKLSDGSEVRGVPITVNRAFAPVIGRTPTPLVGRSAGFTFDYFTGAAGRTLATSDFTGAPDHTLQATTLQISPDNTNTALWNMPDEYRIAAGGSNTGLGIRITGSFSVTEAGEYGFSFDNYRFGWSSFQLSIDGTPISSYDLWNGSTFGSLTSVGGGLDSIRSLYLLPGEHDMQILLANYSGTTDANSQFSLWYRDAQGITTLPDSTLFYTLVPEPGSLVFLASAGVLLMRRSRR